MSGLEILEPGIQATVQDPTGRPGMLRQGFFPSGAMDYFALQAANLLVGNPREAAGIEVTLGGFAMRLQGDATIAVCGAEGQVTLDGEPLPPWSSRRAGAGAELRIAISPGPGFRFYVAVSGAIDVPELFGSRATYTMGGLGGYQGRALTAGDELPVGTGASDGRARRLPDAARPAYGREWEIEVMRGPQATPDYLTERDMEEFLSRSWAVDRNSDRTGVRLESHRFEWARKSGGVAGGHPSNILDNPYPVGAVNINGDLPVLLGPDGPTAGGFIVAATVVRGALWKLGQLRPIGDHVRFREVTLEESIALERELSARLTDDALEPAG
ncbi:MAG: 5-oxoprolinase/urea amidolyase family protein [Solirubrobacterales bacterium]|nr:5-oxoprolinase/urea amidolyase family protein [Solirubrobacterales bacterium]MBV9716451.1 5-oxoprolinase/urea amidolyase family protein [Solirubrobacterales bacterium]